MTAMLRIELLDDIGVLTHQCDQSFPTEHIDRKAQNPMIAWVYNPQIVLRVKSIPDSISQFTYNALGSRDGGEVIGDY